uniref:Uncharacterized protein n=1 Tax=Kalanchoe fedtschenkoi TaxID=63787 RepID=A0A7N0THE6_KALFE
MGISPSKRVSTILANSSEFNSACDSVFQRCLEATQHAFPGLLPYQLATASDLLHSSLLTHPLFVAFAVDLFTDAVVTSVRNAMLSRVPIGVGGIVGVGVLTKSRKDLVGTAVGVYALGVAASVYLSISGSN